MKRILVVDDDENVRESFLATLEPLGYEVVLAAGGPEGLESAKAKPPDLVFLDLKMPGMNGAEVLEKLHDICPEVRVYVITAFYAEFLKPLKHLQGRGISFDVARKPLTVSEIRAIAQGVLENASAHDVGDSS